MLFDMSERTTRAQRVLMDLRADILGGRLTPGQRLPFAELTDRYCASMGVLREALANLEAQGLVESVPRRGHRVTPISPEDLRHLTDARIEIESLVLKRAIAEGDLAWESKLLACHHTLASTPQFDPSGAVLSEEWNAAHNTFHRTLLEGCGNPRLRAIAHSLHSAAELYRRWSLPLGHDYHRDVAGEHRAILEAVLARDVATACDLLCTHLRRTAEVLLNRDWYQNGTPKRAVCTKAPEAMKPATRGPDPNPEPSTPGAPAPTPDAA